MRAHKMLLVSGVCAAAIIAGMAVYVSRLPVTPITPELAVPSVPQPQPTPEPAPQLPVLATYANEKHGFSVLYPEAVAPMEDAEEMAVSGYIPTCGPETAIVCFPYGETEYEGTNFESAAFSVHVLAKPKTEKTCLAPQMGELADGEARFGGVSYKKFSFGDAAMSHRLAGENYRAFRDGSCFEVSTRVASTVFEVWEPGTIRAFTDADHSAVQGVLDAMLMSFRFH